jgi:hypothetical protein
VQAILFLLMVAAIFASAVCGALGWAGLPVERVALVSAGVALTATSLLYIGEAVNPGWSWGGGNPHPGAAGYPLNRLTALGFGLWFGAGGVIFLGHGWLTEHLVPGLLGAFPAGFVLVVVGEWVDRRRAAADRAPRPRG